MNIIIGLIVIIIITQIISLTSAYFLGIGTNVKKKLKNIVTGVFYSDAELDPFSASIINFIHAIVVPCSCCVLVW